jgi:NAD(P)-dependent dehydrogenase (short-subunit alcohol dehydrogenase family)
MQIDQATSPAPVDALIDSAIARICGMDMLVNYAGLGGQPPSATS